MTIAVVGRSGSGKGTQAKFIIKRLENQGVRRLETGRYLRGLIKKYKNSTTKFAEEMLMQKGKLFPSWFSAFTWLKVILEDGIADQHWVFDGAPRRLWEAKFIDEVVAWHQRSPTVCIYIRLDPEEATRRLLGRGRADDTAPSIRNRMSFFSTDVESVINYYKNRDRLIVIHGDKPENQVWNEIDSALAKRLGKRWPRT